MEERIKATESELATVARGLGAKLDEHTEQLAEMAVTMQHHEAILRQHTRELATIKNMVQQVLDLLKNPQN